jgi:hypothetical protein
MIRDNQMGDFRRLQRLCRLETGQQPESPSDPVYPARLRTKRPFTRDEVVGSYMLKLGELCGGYLVHFRYMFRPEKSLTCYWTLDEASVIHLTCPGENARKEPVRCRLGATGTVRAGCEDTDEADNDAIEHFKVFFLGRTVSLPSLLETAASAS